MNKRSAMVIAGGLVAALVSAVGAISASFTSGTAAQAQPTKALQPKVRTITRTITIHKKPKHTSAPVQVVTVGPATPASSAPVTVSSGSLAAGSESDDGGEHEGGDD